MWVCMVIMETRLDIRLALMIVLARQCLSIRDGACVIKLFARVIYIVFGGVNLIIFLKVLSGLDKIQGVGQLSISDLFNIRSFLDCPRSSEIFQTEMSI